MPATSTSVNASTNSTAEARKAAITIAHCIGVFLLLKTRPDREQRRAIPRRSHHEGRVFWWSWNHFLLIDGVLSALKWLDIVAPFGSRLGRAQRSTCVLRLRAAYVILGLHGHIPLVSAVRKYRRGGARKSVSMTSHVASYRLPSPPAERRDPPRRPFCGRFPPPGVGGGRENWKYKGGGRGEGTAVRLGERLGVSRRAVAHWEAGLNYPDIEHLQALIALGVQQRIFPAGQEAEEIRALWRAAHQKVLLDEAWLASVLGGRRPALTLLHPEPLEAARPAELPSTAQLPPTPLLDWGEALSVPSFYGREADLATLLRWVVEEGCRLGSLPGLGGIGKAALAVQAMRELASHFEVVLFRSLRDAPECSALLSSCLAVLAPEPQDLLHESLERRLSRLLAELRRRRVLLVLDNLEVLLVEGEALGRLRPGYEGYGQLLEQVAHTEHQSCLLLTSREHPAALRALEGRRTPVRSLRLSGLEASACAQLLGEHELVGSPEEYARLAERYAGNPLALGIVAETIADLFGGAISPFLSGSTILFGSITALLSEQWERLSALEQTLLWWLAILREPVTLEELQAVLVTRLAHAQILEAVDGLRRRSLVERGQRAGSFTLHSVVLEFMTDRLVEEASQEIEQGPLAAFIQHCFAPHQAQDHVRPNPGRTRLGPLAGPPP